MEDESATSDFMVSYLLDELSLPDGDRVERLFHDDEYFADLTDLEDELGQGYLQDTLKPALAHRLEACKHKSPTFERKIKETNALLRCVRGMLFERFLDYLDADRTRAEERYRRLNSKLLFFFEKNNCWDSVYWTAVTFDRAVERLPLLESVRSIESFVFGFAKRTLHEVWREQKKRQQTEADLESEVTEHRSGEDCGSDQEPEEDFYPSMSYCLAALDKQDRELIVEYHQIPKNCDKVTHRKRIAERFGDTGQRSETPNAPNQRDCGLCS